MTEKEKEGVGITPEFPPPEVPADRGMSAGWGSEPANSGYGRREATAAAPGEKGQNCRQRRKGLEKSQL